MLTFKTAPLDVYESSETEMTTWSPVHGPLSADTLKHISLQCLVDSSFSAAIPNQGVGIFVNYWVFLQKYSNKNESLVEMVTTGRHPTSTGWGWGVERVQIEKTLF